VLSFSFSALARLLPAQTPPAAGMDASGGIGVFMHYLADKPDLSVDDGTA
jgi:hypothetical protein